MLRSLEFWLYSRIYGRINCSCFYLTLNLQYSVLFFFLPVWHNALLYYSFIVNTTWEGAELTKISARTHRSVRTTYHTYGISLYIIRICKKDVDGSGEILFLLNYWTSRFIILTTVLLLTCTTIVRRSTLSRISFSRAWRLSYRAPIRELGRELACENRSTMNNFGYTLK